MAYSDRPGIVESISGTIRRTTDYRGRSTRTEWVHWTIGGALALLPLGMLVAILLPRSAIPPAATTVAIVYALPSIALFVRRLHDQGRSGWIALLLAAPTVMTVVYALAAGVALADAFRTGLSGPLYWIDKAISVAVIVLSLWPGQDGPNRYGDDPRHRSLVTE